MSQDPFLKIPHYCNEVLRATVEGKNLLAMSWRIAADAARNYSRQGQTNYIFSFSSDLPDLKEIAEEIKTTQEAQYRLAMALEPLPKTFFSSRWIFSVDEFKEAAWSYRHWVIYSQARDSHFFEREIMQAEEAVAKYRLSAVTASQLVEQGLHSFQRAQKIQQEAAPGVQKDLLIYRWKIAAYEAIHAAIMELHRVAATSWNNSMLMDHWGAASRLASEALQCRVRAAEATAQEEELLALHWSLAAAAASNTCDARAQLFELFPSGNEQLIAAWMELLRAAEQAWEKRARVAAAGGAQQNRAWEQAALWAEHEYDCRLKELELSLAQKESVFTLWKKVTQEAALINALRTQIVFVEKKRGMAFSFYWLRSKAHFLEYKNRKKILTTLWKELEKPWQDFSFCLAKTFFPNEECLQAWAEGKIFPHFEFTCSHSWIYQTATFLQEAGIPCDLSMHQKAHGIMIALCATATPSFAIDPPLSSDVFLVDVVADALPHPAAHFYIVQNPVHAEQLPNSVFMPHWPQSRLIPRDPARGTRFENIAFFGDVENLAPELANPKWSQQLQQELGLRFRVQRPERWHDYSDVDGVIAIRDFSKALHLHKPATKLYNAWLAGAPFIGGRDAAYACDGDPGKDYLMAGSLEEVFQQLKNLQQNVSLRSELVQNGLQRGKAFTKKATLARWEKLIQETLPALALEHQKKRAQRQHRSLFLNSFLPWIHFKTEQD